MMTKEIKIYQFAELSDAAKQTAINHFADINVDGEWWKLIYEDAKTIGLKISSFGIDRHNHCKGDFILAANEVAANIFREHGESCDTYKTALKFMDEWQPLFNDYMDETSKNYESGELEQQMLDLEEEFLSSLLEDYALMLQSEYEYATSEEAIIETIEIEKYNFTEDGNPY